MLVHRGIDIIPREQHTGQSIKLPGSNNQIAPLEDHGKANAQVHPLVNEAVSNNSKWMQGGRFIPLKNAITLHSERPLLSRDGVPCFVTQEPLSLVLWTLLFTIKPGFEHGGGIWSWWCGSD